MNFEKNRNQKPIGLPKTILLVPSFIKEELGKNPK